MAYTTYDVCVPPLQLGLQNLLGLLEKAKAHCAEQGKDDRDMLHSCLREDMFNFTRQVQTCCDMAKNGVLRLTASDAIPVADTESSLDQLCQRVRFTLDILAKFTEQDFDGADDRPIRFTPAPNFTLSFPSGRIYLQGFILPNFYFHLSTAYGLLRKEGVELGKADFLGDFGGEILSE